MKSYWIWIAMGAAALLVYYWFWIRPQRLTAPVDGSIETNAEGTLILSKMDTPLAGWNSMQAQLISIPNAGVPIKLATLQRGQKLHIRLLNNVAGDNGALGTMVRFASERSTLEITKQFVGQSGYSLFQADGLIEIQWVGEVYCSGSTGNSIVPIISYGYE
jgi:hypothetical protein